MDTIEKIEVLEPLVKGQNLKYLVLAYQHEHYSRTNPDLCTCGLSADQLTQGQAAHQKELAQLLDRASQTSR